MSSMDSHSDVERRARERLRAAGLSEERIAIVLGRAAPLLACLDEVAELDPQLPEPALTWQPLEESTR